MMSGTADLEHKPRILDHAGLPAKIEEGGARLLALVEQATSSALPWQVQALLDQGFGPGAACAGRAQTGTGRE